MRLLPLEVAMIEHQRITPMMSFENGVAAIEWLCRVFGFKEVSRITDHDGRIGHAELRLEGARIFLATPTPRYQGPGTTPRRARSPVGCARFPT
jgi:PhnB protein